MEMVGAVIDRKGKCLPSKLKVPVSDPVRISAHGGTEIRVLIQIAAQGIKPQRDLIYQPIPVRRPDGLNNGTKVYQRNRDAPMPLNEIPVNGLPIPRLTEVFFFNIHNLHPGASIGLPLLFRVP